MDRIGANFENALNDMRTKLGVCVPIFLPIGAEEPKAGRLKAVLRRD
jgi:translation elongation factor EF-G